MPLTPPPLSSWLFCGESAEPHEASATRILTYRLPKSFDPADGMTSHHLALCGQVTCEYRAYALAPAEAEFEPVRPLTADDVTDVFGYELDTLAGAA